MKIDVFLKIFNRFLKDRDLYNTFYSAYKVGLPNKIKDFLPPRYWNYNFLTLRDFCIARFGKNYSYEQLNPFDKCLWLARNTYNPSIDYYYKHYYNLGKEWQNYAREHS